MMAGQLVESDIGQGYLGFSDIFIGDVRLNSIRRQQRPCRSAYTGIMTGVDIQTTELGMDAGVMGYR